MKQELICITCPIGCHLTVDIENDEILSVTGNTCPRGVVYAQNECLHPVRVLTSTVVIHHALYPRLPVVTSQPIPKEMLFDVMNEINKVSVEAPVMTNEVILKNVCNLGVDIIASRSMKKL